MVLNQRKDRLPRNHFGILSLGQVLLSSIYYYKTNLTSTTIIHYFHFTGSPQIQEGLI